MDRQTDRQGWMTIGKCSSVRGVKNPIEQTAWAVLNKGTEIEYVKALAGDSSKGVSSAYWTVS